MQKAPSAIVHMTISVIVFAVITIMYWLAADPPSPWIFALTGGGVLFAIGATIYRKRKGHLS